MEVAYANDDLRALCEDPRRAIRLLGIVCARKLRARVADLKAAASVVRLPAGKPHPLMGVRLGQYAVDLTNGQRIVLEPGVQPIPKLPSGDVQWDAVTKVRISEIGSNDE